MIKPKKSHAKAPSKKATKPAKYLPSPGQLGTGVIPVTPPLTLEQARKQLRGF
jgi:hypothetical protein